jgi:hypothetical protein
VRGVLPASPNATPLLTKLVSAIRPHKISTAMRAMLIHTDAILENTIAAANDSSGDNDDIPSDGNDTSSDDNGSFYDAATDPSVPPKDGDCHFMRLPPELRLNITELLLND